MSGTVSGLLGAVSDALGLLTAADPIVLGQMTFTDFAIPEKVTYGGQQQLTVHKLPGGARVIDNTGDDPAPITWSGVWLGLGANDQRTQLEEMRVAGDPVDLTWGDALFSVVITECHYDEENVSKRIRYQVSCTVVPDIPSDEDEAETGTGETPQTEAQASDQGQQHLAKAKKSATARSSIPVPPIPPSYNTPSSIVIDEGTV